ncbi:conserved hypothetical protein [Shimia gijangensis]|uniref:Lysylphosphatidylglycerol synthase TM region n=1 Tax=Shimia gijangensis TaxID=1470563 RepID=A0A1M6TWA6_9RHOB|nr:lysylphosphatidylglycerol synthase transmembrane domain-containing protein [Shimia gijangensis]SHK61219.1 conserved hypothetical protein [Shimia gijangensis]
MAVLAAFVLFGLAMTQQSSKPLTRAWLRAALRLAGLFGFFFLVLSLVDLTLVWTHLQSVSGETIASMIALHFLIVSLLSWRFAIISRSSGAQINMVEACRLTFASTLANMLLPTSLAGDAGRVWLVHRYGLTFKAAIGVGVFDRVIGLASLGVIVFVGATAEPSIVPISVVVVICLLCFIVAGVVVFQWNPMQISKDSPRIYPTQRLRTISTSVVLSLASHLFSIAIAYLFLKDQGISFSSAQLLVLFPAVLFAASVPISIGGWGTRELAATAAFSTIGLPAPIAVAMAALFGLTQVVASAFGTALLVVLNRSSLAR